MNFRLWFFFVTWTCSKPPPPQSVTFVTKNGFFLKASLTDVNFFKKIWRLPLTRQSILGSNCMTKYVKRAQRPETDKRLTQSSWSHPGVCLKIWARNMKNVTQSTLPGAPPFFILSLNHFVPNIDEHFVLDGQTDRQSDSLSSWQSQKRDMWHVTHMWQVTGTMTIVFLVKFWPFFM